MGHIGLTTIIEAGQVHSQETVEMRFLVLLIGLILNGAVSNLLAEEFVCRYCVSNGAAMRPRGLDLQGRFHFAPDRQVDVRHIALDITPDFAKRTFSATATIIAQPISKSVKVLALDAVNLQIKKVSCPQFNIEDTVSTRDDLKIVFADAIPIGREFSVTIEYSAQPEAGLYFRTPEMGYPETDTHLWTQGEPHEARHWFPCFDYPNERSTSEVTCHVPATMTVLSNGKKQEEHHEGNNIKRVRWSQDIPHANYLICLVAGNFTQLEKQHGQIPLGFYSQPSLVDHSANSFEDTDKIMAFYEQEIGIPFPWAKYDQVTIQDFTAGGMENTTLTTLTSNTIFSKESENIHSTRGLDAHELAHQWFGDYVTCKDWSHLWLNEGFATYYAVLYEGHKFGNDAMLYELYKDADDRIFTRTDDKRPSVYAEYNNSMDQFDYRCYEKGGWVLHMLRSQLGPDLYRDCVREYLQTHALGSVVTDDLRQIIERKSGRSMDRFFNQWLYHAGVPALQVNYEWQPESKLAKLSIKQTQEVNDSVMLFELPTKVRFFLNGQPVDHPINIAKVSEDFYFQLDAQPSVVRLDPEYTVLAKVSFDKSDQLLLADLKNESDMIGRLLACQKLAERKTDESIAALAQALNTDAFYGVRQAAAQSLEKIGTPEAREALRQSWQKQTDARVRSRVVTQLLKHYGASTPEIIEEILSVEKNPAIAAQAVEALGLYNSPEHSKMLLEYLEKPSFEEVYASAAITGMERSGDVKFVKVLQSAVLKNSKSWQPFVTAKALRTIAKLTSTQDNKREIRDFVASYLNAPHEDVRNGAVDALGELRDPSASDLLASFAQSPNKDIRSRAESARRAMQSTSPVAPEEFAKLRDELQKLRDDNKLLHEKVDTLQSKKDASKDASH